MNGAKIEGLSSPANFSQPKQIRFVSNDGLPPPKRRRINAAYVMNTSIPAEDLCMREPQADDRPTDSCQTCRKRKTRCSGERPICETCRQHGHACLGYADTRAPNSNSTSAIDQEESDEEPGEIGRRRSSGRSSINAPLKDMDIPESGKPNAARAAPDSTLSAMPPRNTRELQPHQSAERVTDPTSNDYNLATQNGDDEKPSPTVSSHTSLNLGERNRVPYFRYFGPTAIVPGFKQMVVQVKDRRSTGESPSSAVGGHAATGPNLLSAATPSQSGTEPRSTELPFYDPNDPMPNNPLITHLVEIFFTHLGCNFPFLQRERFLQDMDEKRVDAILVDAVCAVSARFSTHPLFTAAYPSSPSSDQAIPKPKSEYGLAFAQRAKSAVVDTFSCPTTAVVQACILLAYEEFGSNHDSGLWMYLGIAIRMAQDLGMQKLEGLKFEGREGPTPKSSKSGEAVTQQRFQNDFKPSIETKDGDTASIEEQKAVERERIDTFWAIFFLDRVISSGTGRPVTLRDKDVELSFPSQNQVDPSTGWPAPFPALIRIIHLYGRVTDLLNNIREVNHVTPETLKRLARMETDLTGIYQRLSPKLHFNAVNFQHYVKAGQGTNFILLHFWFHTLIVLLHQPSLLHSFGGRIQQLFPNSRELSMSSAKTIADILAFAELLDAKSFIGNPFTSQPMYIAACAFLKETEAHTASKPQSRAGTPPGQRPGAKVEQGSKALSDRSSQSSQDRVPSNATHEEASSEQRSAKHTLLASAANQNYQRCYKALESLETYWAGTKYILTALDQKAQGIWDPLLYTSEEVEYSVELPHPEPSFTSPGWRRKNHFAGSGPNSVSPGTAFNPPFARPSKLLQGKVDNPASPMPDPAQAIGWSLTGTTNSPNSNLTFLYQQFTNPSDATPASQPPQNNNNSMVGLADLSPTQPKHQTARAFFPTSYSPFLSNSRLPDLSQAPLAAPRAPMGSTSADPASTSDAEMLLNLHSPYSAATTLPSGQLTDAAYAQPQPAGAGPPTFQTNSMGLVTTPAGSLSGVGGGVAFGFTPTGGDMMLESQDIDMSALGGDMMPWLEYLPQDWMNVFDNDDGQGLVGGGAGAGAGAGSGQGPDPQV